MSIQTFTIELKLDADPDRLEALEMLIKQAARDLLASSMLLSQNKQPQVICRTQDAFYDQREIELLEPSAQG